jgi:hypothetical protein
MAEPTKGPIGFDGGGEAKDACPGAVLAGKNSTEASSANDQPMLMAA